MKGSLNFVEKKNSNGVVYFDLILKCENGMTFRERDFNLRTLEVYTFPLVYSNQDSISVSYNVYKGVSKNNSEYFYIESEIFPNHVKKYFISGNEYISLGGK